MLKVWRQNLLQIQVYALINFRRKFSPAREKRESKENELNTRHFKTFEDIRTRLQHKNNKIEGI